MHRFHVRAAPDGSPASIIVKQPSGRDPELTLFHNEWACLQLLTELCPQAVPRLYAGSAEQRFLVMEDLGAGERLDHALLGDDAERAARTLVSLCETLGEMHAATFGQRARFDAMLAEHGQRRPEREAGSIDRRRTAIESALALIGVAADPQFLEELTEIVGRADSPELEALIHGDPCPDNCQWVGERVRLLDFEHGRFGSVFSDGSYPLLPFPTCWCLGRVPERVVEQAMDAYRHAMGRGMPHAAEESRFARGMVDSAILWAWSMFAGWHMPDVLTQDHEWGRATVRQRILFRFRLVRELLERYGWYPRVADVTRRSYEALRSRWPGVADVEAYPAFRR